MTRANEPYDSKKFVTEEEFYDVMWALEQDSPTEADIVHRMWQELQDLRSLLQKQTY